jgi:hypothetical protein
MKKTEFTSSLIKCDTDIIIRSKIDSFAFSLASKLNTEFSFLATGKWKQGGFIVDEPIHVPEQTVNNARVDYDEPLEKCAETLNTVIHHHPFNMESFSSTDHDYINSHFDCSILYCKNKFTDATLRFKPNPDVFVVTKANSIVISKKTMDLDEVLPKIKQQTYTTDEHVRTIVSCSKTKLAWYVPEWKTMQEEGWTEWEIRNVLRTTFNLTNQEINTIAKMVRDAKEPQKDDEWERFV